MTRAKGDFGSSRFLYKSKAVELIVKPLRGSPLRGAIGFFSHSRKHLSDLVVVVGHEVA